MLGQEGNSGGGGAAVDREPTVQAIKRWVKAYIAEEKDLVRQIRMASFFADQKRKDFELRAAQLMAREKLLRQECAACEQNRDKAKKVLDALPKEQRKGSNEAQAYRQALMAFMAAKKALDDASMQVEKNGKFVVLMAGECSKDYQEKQKNHQDFREKKWPELKRYRQWALHQIDKDDTKAYQALVALAGIEDNRLAIPAELLLQPKWYKKLGLGDRKALRQVKMDVLVRFLERVQAWPFEWQDECKIVVRYISVQLHALMQQKSFQRVEPSLAKCTQLLALASAFLFLKEFDQALVYVNQVLPLQEEVLKGGASQKNAVQQLKARCFLGKGEFDPALEQYWASVPQRWPFNNDWFNAIGGLIQTYQKKGDGARAQSLYWAISDKLALMPDGMDFHAPLFAKAMMTTYPALAGQFKSDNLQKMELFFEFLLALYRKGQYWAMIDLANGLLTRLSVLPNAEGLRFRLLHQLRQVHIHLGQWQEALAAIEEVEKMMSERDPALSFLLDRGRCRLGMGELDLAIEHYEKALELAEKNGQGRLIRYAQMGLAKSHEVNGEPEMAMAFYRLVIEGCEDDFVWVGQQAFRCLGLLYQKMGREEEVALWQEALTFERQFVHPSAPDCRVLWDYAYTLLFAQSKQLRASDKALQYAFWSELAKYFQGQSVPMQHFATLKSIQFASAVDQTALMRQRLSICQTLGWQHQAQRIQHMIGVIDTKGDLCTESVSVLQDDLEILERQWMSWQFLFLSQLHLLYDDHEVPTLVALDDDIVSVFKYCFSQINRLFLKVAVLFEKEFGPSAYFTWASLLSAEGFRAYREANPWLDDHPEIYNVLHRLTDFDDYDPTVVLALLNHVNDPGVGVSVVLRFSATGRLDQVRIKSDATMKALYPWSFIHLFPDNRQARACSRNVYNTLVELGIIEDNELWRLHGENHPMMVEAYTAYLASHDIYAHQDTMIEKLCAGSQENAYVWSRVVRYLLRHLAMIVSVPEDMSAPTGSWGHCVERPMALLLSLVAVAKGFRGAKRTPLIMDGPILPAEVMPLQLEAWPSNWQLSQHDVLLEIRVLLSSRLLVFQDAFYRFATQFFFHPNQRWPQDPFPVMLADLFDHTGNSKAKLEQHGFCGERVDVTAEPMFRRLCAMLKEEAGLRTELAIDVDTYKSLCDKRESGTLTSGEHLSLKKLSNQFKSDHYDAHQEAGWYAFATRALRFMRSKKVRFEASPERGLICYFLPHHPNVLDGFFYVDAVLDKIQTFTQWVNRCFMKAVRLFNGKIERGDEWFVCGESAQTPLHAACLRGDVEAVEQLRKVDPKSFEKAVAWRDAYGHCPEYYAKDEATRAALGLSGDGGGSGGAK